jgi:hypothetical protein
LRLLDRGRNVYSVQSADEPGYVLSASAEKVSGYNNARYRELHFVPVEGSWRDQGDDAHFRLEHKGAGRYSLESVLFPGYFVDVTKSKFPGGQLRLQITEGSPDKYDGRGIFQLEVGADSARRSSDCEDECYVNIDGLTPSSTYTLWCVAAEPEYYAKLETPAAVFNPRSGDRTLPVEVGEVWPNSAILKGHTLFEDHHSETVFGLETLGAVGVLWLYIVWASLPAQCNFVRFIHPAAVTLLASIVVAYAYHHTYGTSMEFNQEAFL